MLFADWLETPIGQLLVAADETHLRAVDFCDDAPSPERIERLGQRLGLPVGQGTSPALLQALSELRDYFAGKAANFTVPLGLSGSPFERRVWAHLMTVPLAETCSYGDIARALGDVNLSRAVGEANHVNRIPVIIPCHRCIGSDGSLTGYGGGLWRKTWLLRHEGRMRPVGLFALEGEGR